MQLLGSNTSVYMPGEFDFGGDVGIKRIKIENLYLGENIRSMQIAEVNEKKVGFFMGRTTVFSMKGSKKLENFDARGLDTSNVCSIGYAFDV